MKGVASVWFIESAISLRARMPEVERSTAGCIYFAYYDPFLRKRFASAYANILRRVGRIFFGKRVHRILKIVHNCETFHYAHNVAESTCIILITTVHGSTMLNGVSGYPHTTLYGDYVERIALVIKFYAQWLVPLYDFLSDISIFNSHCISAS